MLKSSSDSQRFAKLPAAFSSHTSQILSKSASYKRMAWFRNWSGSWNSPGDTTKDWKILGAVDGGSKRRISKRKTGVSRTLPGPSRGAFKKTYHNTLSLSKSWSVYAFIPKQNWVVITFTQNSYRIHLIALRGLTSKLHQNPGTLVTTWSIWSL